MIYFSGEVHLAVIEKTTREGTRKWTQTGNAIVDEQNYQKAGLLL